MNHTPVLLNETLEYLNAGRGGKFIDGTAGDGGHTIAILRANSKNQVLAIDWDEQAVVKLKEKLRLQKLAGRGIVVSGNYADMAELAGEKFKEADGIILDLGFSSNQIDDADRGFSFQKTGPLDMRYDQKQKLTAAQIVNHYSEEKIAAIIKQYGEEKFSRRIAAHIAAVRKITPISGTEQLFHLVKEALPGRLKYKAAESARRVFQALRIEVNHELDNVKKVLPQAIELLKSNGRMVAISFHSLEDRIMKHAFRNYAATGKVRILTKKVITASEEEIRVNPRSNSAKLRAIEKVDS